MSSAWDSKKALKAIKNHQEDEIADVLLDQTIFSGVGNIIKNEVLFLVKKKPTTLIKDMSNSLLQKVIKTSSRVFTSILRMEKAVCFEKTL